MCETAQAAELKNMPFVIMCGDMLVIQLHVELAAENPDRFSKLVPWLVQFHLEMSMMNAIYKRYKGSELEEVLVAAGAIAEGSAQRSLKGKHYRRDLRCMRAWCECFFHQLFSSSISELSSDLKQHLEMLRNGSAQIKRQFHDELMESEELDGLVRRTDMADYWMDYLHMCGAMFLSTHANHSATNLQDLIDSQRAMLPWLTIYDNNKYSRWLPYFALPANRRNFLENNFAHSLTGNPYSGQALDMLIEVTMNKSSKLKSGWLSILKNEKLLLVHSRNANNVIVIRSDVHDFINQKKNVHKHTDSTPHGLRFDEQLVQDLLQCIEEFDCNLFDAASPTLHTLQSAIPASQKLINDL